MIRHVKMITIGICFISCVLSVLYLPASVHVCGPFDIGLSHDRIKKFFWQGAAQQQLAAAVALAVVVIAALEVILAFQEKIII